jgi:hypothetical protein
MKNVLIVAIIFLSFQQTTLAKEPKLKKIFNGKNFDGWKLPEDLISATIYLCLPLKNSILLAI